MRNLLLTLGILLCLGCSSGHTQGKVKRVIPQDGYIVFSLEDGRKFHTNDRDLMFIIEEGKTYALDYRGYTNEYTQTYPDVYYAVEIQDILVSPEERAKNNEGR